jgi:small subunit ribosomal protein S5
MSRGREDTLDQWKPKTHLGRMVQEGQITNINDIFEQGYRIKEVNIVEMLVPELEDEVIDINLVQRQTDAGEISRFTALVAIGNKKGLLGLGIGKAPRVRNAIEKGIREAKLNIHPVKRGCGSWECDCNEPHTIPFKVSGKAGSVKVTLFPAPKGLGLVAGDTSKAVLNIGGIEDCWTKSIGKTATTNSFALATFNALKQTMRIMTTKDWTR